MIATLLLCGQELHFEVHLGDFTGGQEKCVDIALAVEMMHYATTPGAYDVAVLLTGDKDFMPAMVRTRQRGKRVALAAFRRSCNRDLLDPKVSGWGVYCCDFLLLPVTSCCF